MKLFLIKLTYIIIFNNNKVNIVSLNIRFVLKINKFK